MGLLLLQLACGLPDYQAMSGEVANYVIIGLISAIAVYALVYNRERIRLFFANNGAEELTESSPLIDILKDQLAYSREDVTALQKAVDEVTEQMAGLRTDLLIHLMAGSKESKIDIGRVENTLGQINNRLENYRFLLSKLEENTRK